MLRRFCTVALACALPVAVLPVASASASEPTAYTYDRIHSGANGVSHLQQAYTPALVSYVSGTVTFARSGAPSVALTPPTGRQLAAETSFPVHSAAATAENGRLALDTLCPATGYAGTVTVHQAAFTEGVPSILAADYEVACNDASVVGSYAGSLRHGTDRSYTLARVTPAAAPSSGVDLARATSVTVLNAGSAAFTPGTPALSGPQASEWAVASDTCAGSELAPGASCAIGLTFTPAALGTRRARLDLPVPGHPRASGAGAVLVGYAVAPPAAPSFAEAVPTVSGPRVAWAPVSGASHYVVFRRPASDAEWTALGEAYVAWHVDGTLPREATAEYAVAAVGDGGTGAKRAAPAITRVAADPQAGTADALILDSDNPNVRAVHHSTSLGDSLNPAGDRLWVSTATASASATLPRVPGPGTYALAGRDMTLTAHGFHCAVTGGTIDVAEALYDEATGGTASYAASFAATCNGGTTQIAGLARFRSTVPYQGVRAPASPADWRVASGSHSDRTLTFASGGAAVTFGAATIGGTDPSYFSVVSNGCEGQAVADGATCDVVVRATMSGTATRNATVTLADDTARGSRTVALTAIPLSLPGAPSSMEAHPWRIGMNNVGWVHPDSDGNSPVTSYRLYRQVGDAAPELLLDAKTLMFTDKRAPGASQRYGVSAVNAIGEGAVAWTQTIVTPAQELVYVAPHSEVAFGLNTQVPGEPAYWLSNEPFQDHDTPAVSPDGSLIAYAKENGSGYDLFVRNADGSGTPRNVTGATMGGLSDEYDATFSNDGRFLAFTRETETAIEVWQVPVAGGTPAKRANDAASPSWLPDSRSLVVSDYASESGRMLRIAPNNTRSGIPGTEWGDEPAVSPDGRWIAFSRFDPVLETTALAVVPVAGATSPKLLRDASGMTDWFSPAWRGDGKALLASRFDGGLSVVAVSWNGTSLAQSATLVNDSLPLGAVWRSVGLKLVSPPYLTRSAPSIAFQVSAPYTTATCALDSGAPAPCASPWTRTGVTAGAHMLTIRTSGPGVVDRVLTHSFTVDAAAPVVSTSLPSTAVVTGSAATFRYAATDASGVASYDARYRRAPYNGTFGAFTAPAGWSGTRSTQLSLAVTPGSEYCFSVRARDAVGNVSGWSAERCTASPLDDRQLGGTGWSRLTGTGYYRSTYSATTTAGRTLAVGGVQAKRLVLVATRCATCGTVAVYLGTTLVGTVNLAASTTQKAAQIALPPFTSVRAGTVTLKVTSSGKTVQIDGLGVRRT